MALSKKPMKKSVDTFINAGGTAPKKEKEPKEFERLELRVPPEIKAGIKVFAALKDEKMIDVVTEVFLKGCEAYQNIDESPILHRAFLFY